MRVPAAERKEKLIEATIELMRRGGVQRLNLRGIADEAGASLATVHYCFSGKDDLLRSAVEHWLSRMTTFESPTQAEQAGLAVVVRELTEDYWSAFVENPKDVLAQIELVTWAVREQRKHGFARNIYRRYLADLGQKFDRVLQLSGEKSSWDMQDFASTFLMLIDGASLQYLAEPDSPRPKRLLDRSLALLVEDVLLPA